MKLILEETYLLPRFLKRWSKKSDNVVYFNYSEKICNQIIGEKSLLSLNKLEIDKFETIFIKSKPFSKFYSKTLARTSGSAYKKEMQQALLLRQILKGKQIFVCRLTNDKGYYEFDLPEAVEFEIISSTLKSIRIDFLRKRLQKKHKEIKLDIAHIKKIQSYLVKINAGFLRNCITLARRDFDFVERFNNEMFHQNIVWRGRQLSRDEVYGIYEDERFMRTVDLSDIRERIAFISLYGIAVKGLSLNDFYLIDGIFSLQSNRERDALKQVAGNEVFDYIANMNNDELTKSIFLMGEALLNLPVPNLNINDFRVLRQNFSLYCGIADIGLFFSRIIIPDNENKLENYKKFANRLIDFSLIEKLFDIFLKGETDITQTYIYETVLNFEKAIKNKKVVAELNHGSKEFKD